MGASVKFNGGNTLLVYDGTGSATLESLGLATAGEIARLKADLATAANVTKQLTEERDELAAWQLAVADGLGFVNRAEGQSGYDVAAPSVILAAWRECEERIDGYDSACLEQEERAEKAEAIQQVQEDRARELIAEAEADRAHAEAELAAEREIQAALQESLAKEVTAHLETARERDEADVALEASRRAHHAATRGRDALKARACKAKEALESHQCADDKDLDGCMACDALNILAGEARS